MKKALSVFLFIICLTAPVLAEQSPVRIKDIAHVLQARDNQLMGFGLVVGLKNTGDSTQTDFTKQALTNLLSRMGIVPQDKEFKAKNVASVMVTAKLPPFVKAGQKVDVVASSMGDATSLLGGTLLMTPLSGLDDNVYAVAQGQLNFGVSPADIVSGVSDKKQNMVGRIMNGAIVEKEVPVTLDEDFLAIVIDRPDYTTSSRVAKVLNDMGYTAKAKDAAMIIVSKDPSAETVDFVAGIENMTVIPDSVAKITVNEQSGIIVMGEEVKIAPVAISYADINVTIAQESTISKLVAALNAIGVRPKDLIAILQAIKSAGAISADIEVI
jgi:flagellar P-ring protein FlgI